MGSELGVTVPVILLKNASSGHTDPYTTHFSSKPPFPNVAYQPVYIPVLEHSLHIEPILSTFQVFSKIQSYEDATTAFPVGGLIFTSQRAVEAFASALDHLSPYADGGSTSEGKFILQCLEHLTLPLYAVGPATALSLDTIRQKFLPGCWILGGEDAGTGEILAKVILKDYNTSYFKSATDQMVEKGSLNEKKPLLFLTGAKHRDIIPVTLASAASEQRIDVEEMIVYASTESLPFASNLATALFAIAKKPVSWIVIFSPTGVSTLLRTLGWLDDDLMLSTGQDNPSWVLRKTFIASIGPTTRDYMKQRYGFEVDICAEKPSPEGVRQGIENVMRKQAGLP